MPNNLANILSQVHSIVNKYQEIAQITGENFNIFKILNLQTDEVRLHSNFLVNLLNPEGSHGQGGIFLKLFIDYLTNVEKINENTLNVTKAKAISEFYIGKKTDDSGGRIDIYVHDNKNSIVIENKIYAVDQENQLLRYYNYFPNASLYYLTLEGDSPSLSSTGNKLEETKHFFCISYKYDIVKWLEQCRKEAVSHPMLRESLSQYIFLIKSLTNQTTNKKMSMDVVKQILHNSGNLEAFFEIFDKKREVYLDLLENYLRKDLEQLASDLNLELDYDLTLDKKRFNGFSFKHSLWKDLEIRFHFDDKDTKRGLVGIIHINKTKYDKNSRQVRDIQEMFRAQYPKSGNGEYFLCYYLFGDWTKLDYLKIYNHELHSSFVKDNILKLKDIIETEQSDAVLPTL